MSVNQVHGPAIRYRRTVEDVHLICLVPSHSRASTVCASQRNACHLADVLSFRDRHSKFVRRGIGS